MIDDSFGFDLYRGDVVPMNTAHRHQELELNLLFQGSMTYLFGAETLTLSKGQLSLFWATTPHRLISCEADTALGWLTIPLASFLRYGLADPLVTGVLQGKPITATFSDLDAHIFNRWLTEQPYRGDENQTILELELEALLRRIALATSEVTSSTRHTLDSNVAQLAQYIAKHYQEPLSLGRIAASVSLHPNYAATLFKNSFGMTIHDYLSQYRIAHAQRLLVTTDMPILELAFEAGFGSSSQFYAAFTKACAKTPRTYRQALRHSVP